MIVQVSVVLRKIVGQSQVTLDSEDLTLKMTTAEAVETSVTTTCNSLSQDCTNLDDHISQTSIDTPRFKPFALIHNLLQVINKGHFVLLSV